MFTRMRRYFAMVRSTIAQNAYTRREMEKMDLDELDHIAFGVVSGEILRLDPEEIKVSDPLLEEPKKNFMRDGAKWLRSVNLRQPIEVFINSKGEYVLEQGVNRWFVAKQRGKSIFAKISIKANTIDYILSQQAKGRSFG
jgi:hypothetical protein